MKKTIMYLLLYLVPTATIAQFKINSSGTATLCTTTTPQTPAKLTIGNEINTYSQARVGLNVNSMTTEQNTQNIGVNCVVDGTGPNNGTSIGVRGLATGGYNDQNFGVLGSITGPVTYGAAIFGAINSLNGISVGGRYAGYFYGSTCVNGILTATHIVENSDRRLKGNITSLRDMKESTLSKLLDINVVEYNFKPEILSSKLPDSVSIEEAEKYTGIYLDKKHIGVIAQELQTLYPDMVVEGQDGYLAVNYIELIPVLIRSVQELKQELDEAKSRNGEVAKSRSEATAIAAINATTGNVLYQNTPNPFKEQTTIRFSLADNAQNAAICIFDMTGKMLKQLPISSGDTSVSINGWELGEGMFLYTLLVNGREIDTKRMVIMK